jgi:uncharacterized protein
MTRIILLSDTHYRKDRLGLEIIEIIKEYDHIIHAGDFINENILDELERTGRFTGVAGNNDSWDIHERLGERKILEIEGIRLGICHGDGLRMNAFENAKRAFETNEADIVIFGHSHYPFLKKENGVLYVNPGSVSLPRAGSCKSMIEMTLKEQKVECGIIEIEGGISKWIGEHSI